MGGFADFSGAAPSFSLYGGPPRASFSGTTPSGYSSLIIAADAQIHNRRELAQGIGDSGLAACDNTELLAAAYSKWGEDCCRHLAGEYSFAIWDGARDQLFCCRDHLACRPFYYCRVGDRFLFASEPSIILAMSGETPRLNRRRLAEAVLSRTECVNPEETPYAGILTLPAATWLRADRRGIQRGTYWAPGIRSDLVPRQPRDAFRALREILFEAVESRVRDSKQPAVFLSGGLDSSALAAVASQRLGGNRRLRAVASVLPDNPVPGLTDERAFIEEFRSWANIDIDYVSAPGKGPFESLEDPPSFAFDPFQSSRAYLYEALESTASSAGCDVILDGNGGEYGLTAHGYGCSFELAATLRWPSLVKQLCEIRAVSGHSPVRTLAREFRDFASPRSGSPVALLSQEFLEECRSVPDRRDRFLRHRSKQVALLNSWLARRPNRAARTADGRARIVYPWRDKRVLEFCISAPDSLKIRNGYRRYLVRGTLEGMLPDKILRRTSKGPFAPDYYVRFNAQLGMAKKFVAAIRPGDPVRSIIDVTALEKLLYPVDELRGSPAALTTIPCSLYLIRFLRQFPEFRP